MTTLEIVTSVAALLLPSIHLLHFVLAQAGQLKAAAFVAKWLPTVSGLLPEIEQTVEDVVKAAPDKMAMLTAAAKDVEAFVAKDTSGKSYMGLRKLMAALGMGVSVFLAFGCVSHLDSAMMVANSAVDMGNRMSDVQDQKCNIEVQLQATESEGKKYEKFCEGLVAEFMQLQNAYGLLMHEIQEYKEGGQTGALNAAVDQVKMLVAEMDAMLLKAPKMGDAK